MLPAENPYYLELGKRTATRQRRWQEFLLGEDDKEEDINLDDLDATQIDFRSISCYSSIQEGVTVHKGN